MATGKPVTDADGTRTASVVFPAGTHAEMVLPDGTKQPLGDARRPRHRVHRRRERPRRRCPARCPPSSGLHLRGRAVGRPGRGGRRDRGALRPAGRQLRRQLPRTSRSAAPSRPATTTARPGEWMAAPNGRVDQAHRGSSTARRRSTPTVTASPTAGSGIDDAERARLAATRHVGDELWRVPMDPLHPVGPQLALRARPRRRPAEAARAARRHPRQPEDRRECNKEGSIIGCQGQTLGEELPVTGAPLRPCVTTRPAPAARPTARSRSRSPATRSPTASRRSGWRSPSPAATEKKDFAPKKDLSYEYVWDRKDAYGREVQGRQPVTIKIGWVYGLRRYEHPGAVGRPRSAKFGGSRASVIGERARRVREVRQLARRCTTSSTSPSAALDARGTGLGGWELDRPSRL